MKKCKHKWILTAVKPLTYKCEKCDELHPRKPEQELSEDAKKILKHMEKMGL